MIGARAVAGARHFLRWALAVLAGNLLGYAAFRLALWLAPLLWREALSQGGAQGGFSLRALLTAVTAILFAAPPVLLGAGAARLAGRARSWAGLAACLWGLGFAWWWPASVPLLGPDAWAGPAVLVLLSGLAGGWLMEQRAALRAHSQANRPQPVGDAEDVGAGD